MARVRAARAVTAAEVDTTEDGRMLGLWLGDQALALVELDERNPEGSVDRLVRFWRWYGRRAGGTA